jgi:hypothetical protein
MSGILRRAMLGLGLWASLVSGQVTEVERDTKVTGPRGRTIERDVKVERGPGFVDRQVEIKRPGETIIRDTRMQTGPAGPRFGPGFAPPRFYGGPRFVENVIVQRPPAISTFIGLPALSLFVGGAGGAVGGGFGGGGPVGPGGPPQSPPAFDPFADAMGRLKSFHASSRRDGALTLARIGDPRAVPALNERLEHDFDKDVRVAAAFALGEIKSEGGAVALEKAVLHDKRHDVRDAAKLALEKIPKPGEVPLPANLPPTTRIKTPPPIPTGPSPIDPGPSPSRSQNVPLEAPANDLPPPPPVPANPGTSPSPY